MSSSGQNDAGVEPRGRVSVLHACVAVHVYRRPQLDPDPKHFSTQRPTAHLRRGFHYTRLSESHGHRSEMNSFYSCDVMKDTLSSKRHLCCNVTLISVWLAFLFCVWCVQDRSVGSMAGECGCCTCWRVSATAPSSSPVSLSCWTSSAQLSIITDWWHHCIYQQVTY